MNNFWNYQWNFSDKKVRFCYFLESFNFSKFIEKNTGNGIMVVNHKQNKFIDFFYNDTPLQRDLMSKC